LQLQSPANPALTASKLHPAPISPTKVMPLTTTQKVFPDSQKNDRKIYIKKQYKSDGQQKNTYNPVFQNSKG
jgi:hypothetical protein